MVDVGPADTLPKVMPKKILIVENDRALSGQMKADLERRGFEVEETAEGKKSVDIIRRSRPDLVILGVELTAGQSGYVICGKLKKDDALCAIPVVMVGNPDGFVQHSKLKTRADEYVPKPVDLEVLSERVRGLLGMPPQAAGADDDALTVEDVVEADDLPVEEISLDDATFEGDPELDLIDQAFGASSQPASSTSRRASPIEEESVEAPPEVDSLISPPPFADAEELEKDAGPAVESWSDSRRTAALEASIGERRALAPGQADVEIRSLRAQLAALQRSLAEAQRMQSDAEDRARELEGQLESRGAELEALAAKGGKGDKEFFALREALNKKEKEVLLLSTGLRDKETEMVELRDHEVQLEQQLSESSVELARRDAQIKTLSGRLEQIGVERKRLQEELNETRNRLHAGESEAEELRARVNELDGSLRESQAKSAGLLGQIDALQSAMNAAHREAQQNQARISAEADQLRARLQEVEQRANRQEERLSKLFQRIKGQDKVRDKTKKALSIALQLLEEQATADEDGTAAA
ncbi:MAG TPA: response regulator [Myxococcaceae bacterium]|nr:response regulator [Myxococcaceae bacterium]